VSIRVYDLDKVVEDIPRVRLRGVLYKLSDMPMRDRVKREREYLRLEEQLLAVSDDGEVDDNDPAFTKFRRLGVAFMLTGVPVDVVDTMTEREFDALRIAFKNAKQEKVTINESVEDEDDEGSAEGNVVLESPNIER